MDHSNSSPDINGLRSMAGLVHLHRDGCSRLVQYLHPRQTGLVSPSLDGKVRPVVVMRYLAAVAPNLRAG
jgi:hypothetical protein